MKRPKVSVIIPVYNAEKYLRRCVDSILAQTFTDFELLLVDDGSKDASGAICDEYADRDNRVRVFHKENGGVSSARNLGLDNARGEWVTFCDADDEVTGTYLEDMIQNETPSSLIFSLYSNKGDSIRHLPPGIYENESMVNYVIDNKVFNLSGPYAKLYRTDIVKERNITFPVGINMGEDGIFIAKYLNVVERLIVIDSSNYIVNTTQGSISSNYYSFDSEWRCYSIWKSEIYNFVTRYKDLYENPLRIVWENRIGSTFLRCLQCTYMLSGLSLMNRLRYLYQIPKKDYSEFKYNFHPTCKKDRVQQILINNKLFLIFIISGRCFNFLGK